MITAEELKIDDQDNIVKLLNNYDFINSLVAICIDTFCFINGLKIEFKEVLRVSNINYNDYWRIISNFAHFDKDIHISISEHIFNRERGILRDRKRGRKRVRGEYRERASDRYSDRYTERGR